MLRAGINVYSAKFCIGISGISDKLPIRINFIDWWEISASRKNKAGQGQ